MATEIKPKIIQLKCIFTFPGLKCQQNFENCIFFLTKTYFCFKNPMQYNDVLMTGASKDWRPFFIWDNAV